MKDLKHVPTVRRNPSLAFTSRWWLFLGELSPHYHAPHVIAYDETYPCQWPCDPATFRLENTTSQRPDKDIMANLSLTGIKQSPGQLLH